MISKPMSDMIDEVMARLKHPPCRADSGQIDGVQLARDHALAIQVISSLIGHTSSAASVGASSFHPERPDKTASVAEPRQPAAGVTSTSAAGS